VQYDSGVAFPAGFDDTALLKEYSSILVDLKDTGEITGAGGGVAARAPPVVRLCGCAAARSRGVRAEQQCLPAPLLERLKVTIPARPLSPPITRHHGPLPACR